MKCSDCRKLEAELDGWWDRVRLWMFNWFKDDIIDLSQDKFTQGFSDGYKEGFKQAKIYEETFKQAIKESTTHRRERSPRSKNK